MVHAGTAEIVKNMHLGFCSGEQVVGQIGTDKSSAAEDQYRAGLVFGHFLYLPYHALTRSAQNC